MVGTKVAGTMMLADVLGVSEGALYRGSIGGPFRGPSRGPYKLSWGEGSGGGLASQQKFPGSFFDFDPAFTKISRELF